MHLNKNKLLQLYGIHHVVICLYVKNLYLSGNFRILQLSGKCNTDLTSYLTNLLAMFCALHYCLMPQHQAGREQEDQDSVVVIGGTGIYHGV